MAATKKNAESAESTKKYDGFDAEERSAMKARAAELKAESARRGGRSPKPDPEAEVLAKIAGFEDADRVLAEAVHAVVKANAPALAPKLWYGMPAYALDGKIVCFFQPAQKFKTRYATVGFNDPARLDDGTMWPTAFALTELTAADEARLAELVKRAAG